MSDSTYRLTIGGESVEGAAGTYDIVNPATEEIVGRAPEASVEQANAAVEAAAGAFDAWSRTSPEERAALMERAADLIDAHADEIVPVLQAETGATMRVAKTMQFPQASARLRRYAQGALESNIVPLPPAVMPTTALAPGGLISAAVHRAPVGVVTCITSYNFPMTNMAGKIGPALAMGNTVVVKPAPQDPLGVRPHGRADERGRVPARRGQRRHRPGHRAVRGRRRPPAHRHGLLHRLDRRRSAHRRGVRRRR